MVDCQRQRDDSVTPLQPMPVPCATCGAIPEFIVEVIRPFVEGQAPDDGVVVP